MQRCAYGPNSARPLGARSAVFYHGCMTSRLLRFRVGKLIRDGMLEAMHRQGLRTFERVMDEHEFRTRILDKLVEEAVEVQGARTREELIEELADVHEVLLAVAASHGLSRDEIEARRLEKRSQCGGFEARIYNEAVETTEHDAAASYYLARPNKYPRM
jgi:predicted house-cleaning noncanonical NTP pyrophosphatase (MazG superfamily)